MTGAAQAATSNWFEETLAPDFLLRRVEWFFNRRYEVRPGFLYGSFSTIPIRTVYLSEQSFINLENRAQKLGLSKHLYAAGKEMGYRYLESMRLPKKDFVLREAVVRAVLYFFKETFDFDCDIKINWRKEKVWIRHRGLVVSRSIPFSFFWAGSWAGTWAYILNDLTVETDRAERISTAAGYDIINNAGPPALINAVCKHSKFKLPPFSQEYLAQNQPIPSTRPQLFAIKTSHDILCYTDINGETFFPLESGGVFLLESHLSKEQARNLIYPAVFDAFKEIGAKNKVRGNGKALQYACDFFTSLGWGLAEPISNNEVQVRGFPWTPEVEKIGVPVYFTAAFDGFLSGLKRKKVKSKVKGKLVNNEFVLRLS